MKKTLLLCSVFALALAGCGVQRPAKVDGQVVLNGLGGPEVKGVNATLLDGAKSAEEVGDYARAAQYYAQLIEQNKKSEEYMLAFAEANRKMGRQDIALNTYETILKLKKNNVDALEGKALALLDSGEFKKAGDVFAKVMEKDDKRWRTLNGLGILFVVEQRHEDAMAYFAEALKRSKNNAAVLNNVGLTMAIDNRMEDAVEALKKAGHIAEDNQRMSARIAMNLALVYAAKGDLKHARKEAGKYLSGPALDNNMGLYAHLAKDDVLAKSYLNMALTKSSRYYDRAWKNLDDIQKQENETRNVGKLGGKRVKVK